ncbi:hypothetical protein NPIL_494701 [Nephila pilipes]|uniref:Uncharacterized protein n=1 Tax=Nephila pilipes TaxID=299642 RepID=A0A8X6MUS7_NEPPI|nr:hypothetical protein NPIL_494701 [Nephila pilipes]
MGLYQGAKGKKLNRYGKKTFLNRKGKARANNRYTCSQRFNEGQAIGDVEHHPPFTVEPCFSFLPARGKGFFLPPLSHLLTSLKSFQSLTTVLHSVKEGCNNLAL